MAIPGVCPSCQAKFPLSAALLDARARKALDHALRIAPSLADRIVSYLDLFSPGDRRAIRMDRLASLLEDLAVPIREATVIRNGAAWPAPAEYWSAAFDQVLSKRDNLTLPLKSHGYLFEVVAGIASRGRRRSAQQDEDDRHRATDETRAGSPIRITDGASLPKHLRDICARHGGTGGPGDSDAR